MSEQLPRVTIVNLYNPKKKKKVRPEPLVCKACKKKYRYMRTLRRHVLKAHPKELSELAPRRNDTKTFKFKCDFCPLRYNNIHHLHSHIRKKHTKENHNVPCSRKVLSRCTLCDTRATKKELTVHFKEVHDINLDIKELHFESYDLFLDWKEEFERETKAKFVQERGIQTTVKSSTKHFFVCHRSGQFESQGQGKRRLKSQGTAKINAFCPARINAIVDKSGKCTAEVTSTHVGHSNDLHHLYLKASERQQIAEKIAAKVPFDVILDEVRDSVSESGLDRIHLLTRKDLFNIGSKLNLQYGSSIHCKDDDFSIQEWVNQLMKREKSFILFYKPQGTFSEFQSELLLEDFVLIIMNEPQCELLKQYGSDCICIDRTHETNVNGFELFTLLIVDDLQQGFPCSFMLSNRADEAVLSLFFSLIRERTGTLATEFFMSDIDDAFFNAWSSVMGPPHYKLYCSWHVDRDWRENLVKIAIQEKQPEVYKILRSVMQESDKSTFEKMLKEIIDQLLNDNDLNDFGFYLINNYFKCASSWAYSHRLNCGFNANVHLERMHKTIEYIYLKGTHCKRLDKSIGAIMKFVRDKPVDRAMVFHKKNLPSKLKELLNRHKASLELPIESVTESENGWIVSSSSKVSNNVQKLNEECSCQFACDACQACIHQYQCTCLDSSVKWNMCKHIHLVCRYKHFSTSQQTADCNVSNNSGNDAAQWDLQINSDSESNETETIIAQLKKTCEDSPLSLAERIGRVKRKFMDSCDKVQILEQVEVLEKMHTTLDSSLEAVYAASQNSNSSNVSQSASLPHNQKIQLPRLLFFVKKVNK